MIVMEKRKEKKQNIERVCTTCRGCTGTLHTQSMASPTHVSPLANSKGVYWGEMVTLLFSIDCTFSSSRTQNSRAVYNSPKPDLIIAFTSRLPVHQFIQICQCQIQCKIGHKGLAIGQEGNCMHFYSSVKECC